jgi:osmoprotectant transport system permease protein
MSRLFVVLMLLCSSSHADAQFTVGSKRFTESYILGEIIAQSAGPDVVHERGLGNTGIVVAALRNGSIDVYPEYTGTIAREILKSETAADLPSLNDALAPLGLGVGVPLGFNNTYGLATREEQAQRLGIQSISDLARFPELKYGLSQEFLGREDGWLPLKQIYSLDFVAPRGLDHGLSYEALANSRIDVIDVYTTDAKIEKFQLRVLRDDREFFPPYDAVLLYRLDVPQRFPRIWARLQKLQGTISEREMRAMNAAAELEQKDFASIASAFLGETESPRGERERSFLTLLFGPDFWRLGAEHVVLVFVSLFFGVLVAVPLGIWAARSSSARQPILSTVGVIQTIPSLALLAFLIPLLHGIGTLPALAALFLYSLLPIVRNTYTGLTDIAPSLKESASALGLPHFAQLRLIEIPLASRAILAGVKTAAVINVGTATIAAFIGAGGFGDRIAAGLALNDNAMLLAGAIPAAALALLVQFGFDLLDRWLIPAPLR